MTIKEQVEKGIATFDGSLARAREKWSGPMVWMNSFVGGIDPKMVIGAIDAIGERGQRWKERGGSLAAGSPMQLGGYQDRALHPDNIVIWTDLGNELIRELEQTADDAQNASLDAAVVETASTTSATVTEAITTTATDLNTIGAKLWSYRKWILIALVPLAGLWILAQLGITVAMLIPKRKAAS